MTKDEEKFRVKELGPEDIEDEELREIMNGLLRGINRSNERGEQLREGKISPKECGRLSREDEKELKELRRRLKAYEKKNPKPKGVKA